MKKTITFTKKPKKTMVLKKKKYPKPSTKKYV